jgi:hypothetical protein
MIGFAGLRKMMCAEVDASYPAAFQTEQFSGMMVEVSVYILPHSTKTKN